MDELKKIAKTIEHRVPHYHKDFPLILFWSQKSGCTSLIKWFFYQIGLLDKALAYDPWVHNFEFLVYKKEPKYLNELILQINKSEKDTYKLVRNPYKRAVSSFIMFTLVPKHFPTVWQGLREDMGDYFYQNKKNNEGFSFKQFLQYIKKIGVDVASLDGHFAQQFVVGEEKYVTKYIYLENFNNNIRELEQKYGLTSAPLEKLSQSDHHFTNLMTHKGKYANVRTTDPSFPNLPTFESFFDEETKSLVEDLYKKDFEMYSYKKSL